MRGVAYRGVILSYSLLYYVSHFLLDYVSHFTLILAVVYSTILLSDPSGVVALLFSASAFGFRVTNPTPGHQSNQLCLEINPVPIEYTNKIVYKSSFFFKKRKKN